MTFRFIYQPSEFGRIIPAVCIDARQSIPAIKNEIGSVIKAYTDAEVSKVVDYVLFYKIENTDGNLAGYFSLRTKSRMSSGAKLLQLQLRSSFGSFVTQVSAEITNFVNSGKWEEDYLF